MATMQTHRPAWYTSEDDTAWAKIKAAFRRDWKQTKHDFGGDEPNLDQNAGDTVSQAAGSKPIPPRNVKTPHPAEDTYDDKYEPAYQYGYTAYQHFGSRCADDATCWDQRTEAELRRDWGDDTDWEHQRDAVRRGWSYGREHGRGSRSK